MGLHSTLLDCVTLYVMTFQLDRSFDRIGIRVYDLNTAA
jgi:hypothetical protein